MKATAKLILGTVQLGLNYGINNIAGKPDEEEAFRILDLAHNEGIYLLDTAEAYGNAIDIIGKYHRQSSSKFDIISKFKFTEGINLQENVKASLEKLGVKNLFAYLLHDASKLLADGIEKQLAELKQKQLIKYSGVSVYTNEEFEAAIETDYMDIIQIPYNLLDNNFLRGSHIRKAKEKNKIIHTRSVFLQGLFFMDKERVPEKLQPLQKYIDQVNAICDKNNISKESLALNYIMENEMIDGVLIGTDSAEQLSKNIAAIGKHIPVSVGALVNNIQVNEVSLLNPVNWN